MKYAIPKGTFDILPRDPDADGAWRESHLWQYVEQVMRDVARAYNFQEIRTPIFERTELFVRGVGESSDIVTKEMYTFEDKGERLMTLRPEGTASVMRAFMEKNLQQQGGIQKFFYIGPMFRYERPQAGRYRQHHQFGAEAIGDASAERDVEVIDLLLEVYRRLGLKNLSVNINSVGDEETRNAFRKALKEFLAPKLNELSEDSKVRFEKNPLRILDSKDPGDKQILQGAPSILDCLSQSAKEHFDRVQTLLKNLRIAFHVEPKLVRGLDYYNKTVFEITSGDLGAQNSVGGGGRYDGLLASLGGPDLPAVGFGTGIERIIQTMLAQNVELPARPTPLLFLIPMGAAAKDYCFELAFFLRHQQVTVEVEWNPKKIGQTLQLADNIGSKFALVIGDEELSSGKIKLKELKTRRELELELSGLANFLKGH